jgi:peptidoglycan/LPS O-acetylase OafA/YrhL
MLVVLAWAASAGLTALLDANQGRPLTFFVAGSFSLVALALHRLDGDIARARLLSGVKACGLMCYSLYLLHLPVTRFLKAGLEAGGVNTAAISPLVTIPLCGVASIWLSWQFHLIVERRFMSPSAPGPRTI